MTIYFITGTDTDCGKTYVTCALVRYLQNNHKSVIALKPIASGCQNIDGKLLSSDALELQEVNKDNSYTICQWPLTLPVSPHLAAHNDGVKISASEISDFCTSENLNKFDCALIEGAGGLMVPLNNDETWIDVLKISKIPVILVVGMRLGCINHALLTIFALEKHGIECVGWIANCLDSNMLLLEENIATLVSKITKPCLGIVQVDGDFVSNRVVF